MLRHHRRVVVHRNVAEPPMQQWTTQQCVEAFFYDEAPRYLISDRDTIYCDQFTTRLTNIPIKQVLIAPKSLCQNPYVERLIGSIRRECLDHLVVLN